MQDLALGIKDDRKKDLIKEIVAILTSGLLDPGSAGKLKGKLMSEPASSGEKLVGHFFVLFRKDNILVFQRKAFSDLVEAQALERIDHP